MTEALDLSKHSCWNKACLDYGKRDQGNIVIKEFKGERQLALLRCRTCGRSFSETRGTIFYGLKTPPEEILRVLALLPEKGSIRGLARVTGHDKNVISNWMKKAGEHAHTVTEYFLHDLDLTEIQIDEIWSFIKKRSTMYTR